MEPVTIESLEEKLSQVTDPLERRRMRGQIRRLRRKDGVSPTRVMTSRSRMHDPYAGEDLAVARGRTTTEATGLGLRQVSVATLDPQKPRYALPVRCMVVLGVNKFEALFAKRVKRFSYEGDWLILS